MNFIQTHWTTILAFLPFLWMLLSSFANILLWFKTPEQWIEFAARRPRLASAIRFLRAAGIDPAKAITALCAFLNQEAKIKPAIPPPDNSLLGK